MKHLILIFLVSLLGSVTWANGTTSDANTGSVAVTDKVCGSCLHGIGINGVASRENLQTEANAAASIIGTIKIDPATGQPVVQ